MNFDNKNNSVLITGGTQGLGFEIANQLIENGCSEIIIVGRNKKKGIIWHTQGSGKTALAYFSLKYLLET